MNTLRSLALASTILEGACAHTRFQAETAVSVVADGEPQIFAVRDRVEANCGYFRSVLVAISAPGSDGVEKTDAAVFLDVTRDELGCFMDAVMSPDNGLKWCVPTLETDRDDSADFVVECRDGIDWLKKTGK